MAAIRFFLNVDFYAFHFHIRIVKNQHFQSTLLGGREGGGHKKEYSVYAFGNVDYYGRPLSTVSTIMIIL